MSLPELAERLGRSFQTTSGLLRQLLAGMVQRRTAWISARPSTLAEPTTALDQLARDLAAEEQQRAGLLQQITGLLPPLPGVPAGKRHLDVSAIAAALPTTPATRLRQAAAQATALARELRREIALGERLLQFSARAHDALLHDLTGATRAQNPTYDRSARRAPGQGPVVGSLIDGKL